MYANIKQINPKTGKKKFNGTRTAFIISAIFFPVVNWFVFYVYVNLQSFTMAFQHMDAAGAIGWTFDNFRNFFVEMKTSSSVLSEAIRNTSISFIIGLIMNVNGFLVSYFLYKKIPGSTVFRFIFFLPSIICATVTTAVYKEFIGLNGPVLWLVQKVDKIPVKIDLLYEQAYANKMVFLNMIVFQFASNMIIWGGTFARIPVSVLEAAKLDGVSWIQEITRITVPLVWPTVALQLILSVCGFFGASGDVFLLTRGQNGTMTLSCWMYLQVYDKSNDFNALSYMSAVGLMMSFVAIIVSMLVRKFASSAFNELQY